MWANKKEADIQNYNFLYKYNLKRIKKKHRGNAEDSRWQIKEVD